MQSDTIPEFSLDEYAMTLPYYPGKQLKVAYLIPFAYNQEQPQPAENEEESEMGVKDIDEAASELLPASVNFLEFMEGSLIAIDSLRQEGLSMDIHYFDTHKSPSHMQEDPGFTLLPGCRPYHRALLLLECGDR